MKCVKIRDCTVYHGDCVEMLASLTPGSVDLCFTDPPYGINFVPSNRKILAIPDKLANDEKPHVEFVPPIVKTIKDGGAVYLCTRFDVSAQWVDALKATGVRVKNPVYWIKNLPSQGDVFGDRGNMVEIVLFAHVGRHLLRGKRDVNAWTIPRPVVDHIHPTPKPPELIRRCLQASTDLGDLVLDPFVGSGTTAVACVQTGRRFIGCEIDSEYFELACEQIEKTYRELDNRLPGFDPTTLERQCLLFE